MDAAENFRIHRVVEESLQAYELFQPVLRRPVLTDEIVGSGVFQIIGSDDRLGDL
jgi:hypothetical protein